MLPQRTLRIRNLSPTLSEKEVRSFFSSFGTISNLTMVNHGNLQNAWIEFSDPQTAKHVLSKDLFLGGQRLQLSLSRNLPAKSGTDTHTIDDGNERKSKTVYVWNIDPMLPESAVYECFSYCGEIVRFKFCKEKKSAIVEYKTRLATSAALYLNGKRLGNTSMYVKRSHKCLPVD